MIGAATRRVTSTDGTELSVHDNGRRARPTLVAVHGYPDDHTVWDAVADELDDVFHVVAYDVRGAGESDRPSGRGAYRIERLVDDLAAVVDTVSPGAAVHLVGHDWGSVQSWPALTDPRLAGRIASYTSIAGPSPAHAAEWLRRVVLRDPRALLAQLGESYYLGLFQLPGLPELAIERGLLDRVLKRYAPSDKESQEADPERRSRRRADQLAGLQLYRSNLMSWHTTPAQRITVPVQVLAPSHDPFLTVDLQTQAPVPYVQDLRTHVLDAGHWVMREHPALVARHLREFAASAA
jgi:pimeloyl-ACP methyl ester carboxylesterase